MRRTDREMDKSFALALLRTCNYATFMTVTPDNKPYGVPISPVYYKDALYFHCALEGEKLSNLQNNPNVCVSCVGQSDPLPEQFSLAYQSVIVTGTAALVEDNAEKQEALMEIAKKYASSNIHHAQNYIDTLLDQTAVVKITIQALTAKAHQK